MHPLPATMLFLSLFSFLRCKPASSQALPTESPANREAAYAAHPDALYPVRIKEKWGYMNRRTAIVIPPTWDRAEDFYDGIAVVGRMIDGELRYGYINTKGEEVITPQFERASAFSEGLAAVSRDDQFGYINAAGKEVIPCQFEAAGPFHEGFAGVKINGWTAIIDKTGRVLETPKLTIAVDGIHYVHGLTPAFGADEQTGYLETAGRWAIEPRFHSASAFHEGLAWAMMQEEDAAAEHGFTIKGGYIDTTGALVFPPTWDFGWDFTEGHAVVWKRSADKQQKIWSVIDRSGNAVLDGLTYRNMGAVKDGLIAIQDDDMKWGFMDLRAMSLSHRNMAASTSSATASPGWKSATRFPTRSCTSTREAKLSGRSELELSPTIGIFGPGHEKPQMMRYLSYLLPVLLVAVVALQCRAPSETRLYLVRHTEKAVDGTDDPDLTPEGYARAQKLADMMADKGISRLYATDWKRTRNTLAPLSERTGVEIKIYNWKDTASVDAMLADCKGHVAVICGHSNSTPWLANRLLGEERYEPLADDVYGKLFLVVMKGDKVKEVKVTDY